jgi:uncharacterized protein
MISQEVLSLLRKESEFFYSPIHGIEHWQTVERNGHYLASFNDADTQVLSYFAHFHDCMRENEHIDLGHGPRGASFAKKYRDLIPLNNVQFKQLTDACKGHTYGERPECITINTCWDSDRLDLHRVGIMPQAEYLYNEEAKRIANENDLSMLDEQEVMSKFGQSNEIPPRYENIIFDIKSTSDTGLFNKITSMFR